VAATGDPQPLQNHRLTPGETDIGVPSKGWKVIAFSLNAANAATGAPVTRRQSMQWQYATACGDVIPTN